jgi:hypothetical protein
VTSNYGPLQHLVEVTFSSISCLNASFLSSDHFESSDSKIGLDLEDVAESYKLLFLCPEKMIVTTIGNAISKLVNSLQHYQTGLHECMRVFVILLYNPLLCDPKVFHIVCQNVTTLFVGLPQKIRSVLFEWFKRMTPTEFYPIVHFFQKFLSFLIDQKSGLSLDSAATSCCLNLRWLFEINNITHILPLRFFYNAAICKSINIQEDYITWLTQKNQFSFCQFPFLLDLVTYAS